jgi:hypothetical protein
MRYVQARCPDCKAQFFVEASNPRDEFAMTALSFIRFGLAGFDEKDIATSAYAIADAMMEARKR